MPKTKVKAALGTPFLNRLSIVESPQRQSFDLPNVFVVGAAKSGTTALYHYFKVHPEVFVPPSMKETNYMAFYEGLPPLAGPGDRQNVAGRSITRWDDYLDLFRERPTETHAADVSPAYLYYPQAARKIAELCPQAKIVMVLRNPVEAVFSMYAMMRRDRREPCRTFREAFRRSAERMAAGWEWAWDYQRCFLYSQQVGRFLNLFPQEQLFVRPYESLKNDPARFYCELEDFLGISAIDLNRANQKVNTAPSRRDMLAKRKLGRWLLRAGRLAGWLAPQKLKDRIWQKFFAPPAFVLDIDDRRMLVDYFGQDVLNLSNMLDWDVCEWLRV